MMMPPPKGKGAPTERAPVGPPFTPGVRHTSLERVERLGLGFEEQT